MIRYAELTDALDTIPSLVAMALMVIEESTLMDPETFADAVVG
jgi:hypothetical protein